MRGEALPRQTGNRSREFPLQPSWLDLRAGRYGALPVHKLWISGA